MMEQTAGNKTAVRQNIKGKGCSNWIVKLESATSRIRVTHGCRKGKRKHDDTINGTINVRILSNQLAVFIDFVPADDYSK